MGQHRPEQQPNDRSEFSLSPVRPVQEGLNFIRSDAASMAQRGKDFPARIAKTASGVARGPGPGIHAPYGAAAPHFAAFPK